MTEIIDPRYLSMKNNAFPPQASLYFRMIAGGYLVYLAWDIYKEMPSGILYWIPVIAFAVIGAALVVQSLRNLVQMNREEAEEAARIAAEAAAREEEDSGDFYEEDSEEEDSDNL